MARGTPGNPAPVPTSTTVLSSSPASPVRARLSSRCRTATSLGSVMAVRFITWFFSSSIRLKVSRGSISSGPSPSAGRPCSSVALISAP